MKSNAATVDEYRNSLPEERRETVDRLLSVIRENLDPRFHEEISYSMIGFVVPLNLFPQGYHGSGKGPSPLPFINLASQKNHIALYHMGIYADVALFAWFTGEYEKRTGRKPDMGKSCIRFRHSDRIPYGLIGELAGKMDADRWIGLYLLSRRP